MNTLHKFVALSVLVLITHLSGCATQTYPVSPDNHSLKILVMGEDKPSQSVKRFSSTFARIENALVDVLSNDGYSVFDEAVISNGRFDQSRTRRSAAELMDIARSTQQPPIDVLLLFTAYSTVNKYEYTNKLNTRIEGTLLEVSSGRLLGNLELNAPAQPVATDCKGSCLEEIQGKQAHAIAQDLAAALSRKLSAHYSTDSSPTHTASNNRQYKLIFDGFNATDMLNIETEFTHYEGYEEHRPTYQGHTRSEVWYQTHANSVQLNHALQNTLETLGIKARVQLDGNTIQIQRIKLRNRKQTQPSTEYDW